MGVVASKLNLSSPFLGGRVEENNQFYLGTGYTIIRKMLPPPALLPNKKGLKELLLDWGVAVILNKVFQHRSKLKGQR